MQSGKDWEEIMLAGHVGGCSGQYWFQPQWSGVWSFDAWPSAHHAGLVGWEWTTEIFTWLCHRVSSVNVARKNVEVTQVIRKQQYGCRSKHRQFSPGDQVLTLLPLQFSPFQAKLAGPYTVERQVSELNYLIPTKKNRKASQLLRQFVKILCLWHFCNQWFSCSPCFNGRFSAVRAQYLGGGFGQWEGHWSTRWSCHVWQAEKFWITVPAWKVINPPTCIAAYWADCIDQEVLIALWWYTNTNESHWACYWCGTTLQLSSGFITVHR